MTYKLSLLAAVSFTTAHAAQLKILDLAELAAAVAGQDIRIEYKAPHTVVTTTDEQPFVTTESVDSVADQLCADQRRAYDFGQGNVVLCTARTLD